MRRWQLAVLLGVACLLGTDSASFAPPRALAPATCEGHAPRLTEGSHHRALLGGGESHCYRLELEKDDALHAIVWQQGVDVELVARDPDGAEILIVDSPNADRGFEALYTVAERSGAHELKITGLDVRQRGGYELRIEKLRPADVDDRLRAEAQLAARDDVAGLQHSVALWRQTEDRYQEALALRALGRAYRKENRFHEAAASVRSALDLLDPRGYDYVRAGFYNTLADAHALSDELSEAVAAANTALRLARTSENRAAEAAALNNLGTYFRRRDEFAEAIGFWREALEIGKTTEDALQGAATLHNLGELYSWLGRLEEARDALSEALARYRGHDFFREQAAALTALGWIDYLENKPLDAIVLYREALKVAREIGAEYEEAVALDRLGTAQRALGQLDLAAGSYELAFGKLLKTVGPPISTYTLLNLASLAEETSLPRIALERYEQALSQSRNIESPSTTAHVLVSLSRVFYKLGDSLSAQSRLEEALAIVESLRLRSADYSLRASFLALRRDYYEESIDLLMALDRDDPTAGHVARAFAISERARARSLLDMLEETRAQIKHEADPNLLEPVFEVNRELENLEAEANPPNPGRSPEAIEREKRRLEVEYAELQAKIRLSSPSFREASTANPLDPTQVRALLDDGTVILAYTLSTQRSFLWLIDQHRVTGFVLPARAQIESAANAYRRFLRYPARHPQSREHIAQKATYLSDVLLGQVASVLGRKRLVFLLDGELQGLPMGALPDPAEPLGTASERPPLLARHEIVYLPSASVLPILRRRLATPAAARTGVAVFADAVYSLDDPRYFPRSGNDAGTGAGRAEIIPDDSRWSPLPGSRTEAEMIRHLVGDTAYRGTLGFDANREALLKADLRGFRILHLAAHGQLDSSPLLSGIVLSLYDEHRRPRRGFIPLYEIYGLDLPVDMVVLSACDTALGELVRGEGVIGLPRGFLYAGAARVLVSLWKVDDDATAELMTRFYREMIENHQAPAAALRAAQLGLREDPRWSSPRFWAGFVIQGAW